MAIKITVLLTVGGFGLRCNSPELVDFFFVYFKEDKPAFVTDIYLQICLCCVIHATIGILLWCIFF